ncbi:MAG: hypothetical protein ACI9CF_000674 [Candidatus Omnitrophota bacterium]|jgi:hypothetical protein
MVTKLKKPKSSTKAAKSSDDFQIFNYMEELVNITLRGLVSQLPTEEKLNQRDSVDVRALALNRLWPMYVTTEKGRKFIQKDIVTDKIDRDVTRELRAAMSIVTKRPTKATVSK